MSDTDNPSETVAAGSYRSILPQPVGFEEKLCDATETQTEQEDSEQTATVGVANQTNFTTSTSKAESVRGKRKLADMTAADFGLPSREEIESVQQSVDSCINPASQPVAKILRSETRKSARLPPTAIELELLTKQAPKVIEPSQVKSNRLRLEQIAVQLKMASLWEEDGPLSKYKCLWPCYSAVDHDASLVRIDFIIDYLFNMFFIAHKGTTVERNQLLIPYDSNVAEHLKHREADESQEMPSIDVRPQDVACVSGSYQFDQNKFGPRNARNMMRTEVARPMTNIQDIIQRKNYRSSSNKRSRPDADVDNTTNSQDDEEDDNNEHSVKIARVADFKSMEDPMNITLQQAAKFCKVNASVYEHMYTTEYELNFPHSMTALQQRLFIGRLNRLEMLYTDEQIKTLPAHYAATRAFGLEDFNQPTGWSVKYITALGKTMQQYLMSLFSRIREKSKFEFPFVYGDVQANNLHSFYNSKLRQLTYQIEQFTRLLSLNCALFQQENEPALPEYPSILMQAIVGPHICDEEVYAKMSSYQKMLIELHFKCQELRLRKWNGVAYKEVITDDGFRTNSFKEYATIEQLCNDAPNLITDGDRWLTHTEKAHNQAWCANYMKHTDSEYHFPWLKRQQYVWSFRNGIYDGQQDRFWAYDSKEIRRDPMSPYNRKEASAKYIDKDFDVNLMSSEAIKDPSLIKVEAVDKVLDTQRFKEHVKSWFWGFSGRLYFPQRMLDNWQVVFWLKGVSGTGKSTLIKAIGSVYDPRDVGIMSNNIEPQFGFMGLIDKFLNIAPEVKATFTMDAAMFQTMASADEMSIARKNLDPLSVPAWKVPSIYGSNVYPRWVDSSGSIQRRIMALVFGVAVPKQDTNLNGEFAKQIDAFIVRACRTYKKKIEIVGSDNIWEHVPDEFLVARREVGRQTTELVRFLDEYLVLSDGETPELKQADFVEVADLEKLFLNRRQTGAERHIRFSDQLETEIGSFHNLTIGYLDVAGTPIIRGVRLNLKRIQDVRCDPSWKPAKSSYYTEEQLLAIFAKKEKFIYNEMRVK